MGTSTSREYAALAVNAARGVGGRLPNPPPSADLPHAPRRRHRIPSPRSEPDLRSDDRVISPEPQSNGMSSPAPKRKRDAPSSSSNSTRSGLTNGPSHGSLPHLLSLPKMPSDHDDILVPSVFTWNFGGGDVYVAGAWDDWTTKTPMYKNGPEYIALIYVPCGTYQFKYYVDENWHVAPNLPTRTDEHGNINNIVTVVPSEPEFDSSLPLHDAGPPSPMSSYDQGTTAEYSTDPPLLPPHLEARSLKPLPDDISASVGATLALSRGSHPAPHSLSPASLSAQRDPSNRPFFSHVIIDHLYRARLSRVDHGALHFSQTSRFRDKVINTVFVTRRPVRGADRSEGNGFGHRPPI